MLQSLIEAVKGLRTIEVHFGAAVTSVTAAGGGDATEILGPVVDR